jgi:hypothetical protein
MVNQPQQSTANSWKETLIVATNCCPAMADRSVFITHRTVSASSQLLLQTATRPAQTEHHGS